MFNFPVEDFNGMCNLTSLGATTGSPSFGNNPLFIKTLSFYEKDPSAFLLNQEAIHFITHIAKYQHLGLNPTLQPCDVLAPTPKSSQVEWDHKKCHQWLSMVHMAWERAYCLYHTTSGLPGRTTEEVILCMTLLSLGPTNLFIINGKLQTRSDHSKTSNATGLDKHITRVLHPRLAHIFLILLMCVWPLELQVLKGIGAGNDTVDFVYTTMLFASWGRYGIAGGLQKYFQHG